MTTSTAALLATNEPDTTAPRTERKRILKTTLLYGASFAVALVVGAVLIVLSSPRVLATYGYLFGRPTDAITATAEHLGSAYYALLTGAVGSVQNYIAFFTTPSAATAQTAFNPLSETLLAAGPLILAGLGVAVAFRAGLINVGGQGQATVAGLAAAVAGFWINLPFPVPLIAAALAAMVAGGFWAWVPGALKARFGAHEVVTTIMLNYVALYLAIFLLGLPELHRPGRTDPLTPLVNADGQFPPLFGYDFRVSTGLVIAILAAIAVRVWLFSTASGLELRAVGQSQAAAAALGVNRKKVWTWAFTISGTLVGLGAAIQVLGAEHSASIGTAGFLGIDALVVALLGRTSPLGCVLAGLFVGAMRAGGIQMQALTGVPLEIVEVIEAIAVLIIATPKLAEFFFRVKRNQASASNFTGWAA